MLLQPSLVCLTFRTSLKEGRVTKKSLRCGGREEGEIASNKLLLM